MKKSTLKIIEKFPIFKEHVHAYENMLLVNVALKDLNDLEATFLKLLWFFENPEKENFEIKFLYLNLDNDWLEFALELITEFFREDTCLISEPKYSLIKDGSNYFSLTQFASYLAQEGLRYDRQKLNIYYERGLVPKPDLIIGGVKYWTEKTVQHYKEQEVIRLKSKKEKAN